LEKLNPQWPFKLLLVSAPAGYGKTTLIAAWLRQLQAAADTQICWLSLDEDDSDPQNQFVGGRGFTGLHYSYQPNSGAELQFWCEAGAE
jgi:pantothenate kinase-related protein Tda10